MLKRLDQVTVASLTLLGVVFVAGWWIAKGGLTGELIEIDRAEPLAYQFLVDVNVAEWPELTQLPEVGEVLARRIVQHRQEVGPYRSADELQNVIGIGPRKLARIRGYLVTLPDDLPENVAAARP